MRAARAFLRAATERWTPHRGAHSFTINETGEMVLAVVFGGTLHGFTIDEADLDREPAAILDEIARMLSCGAPIADAGAGR